MKHIKTFLGAFITAIGVLGFLLAAGASSEHDHHEEHENEEHAHDETSPAESSITLSAESQKLGNIKVMSVQSKPLIQKIPVHGRISQDVETVIHVYSERSGTVGERFVTLGQMVSRGELLCVLTDSDNETSKLTAPMAGTIIAEFIKTGDRIDKTTALYTIADMSKLSANFDIYEKDLAHVKLGQKMNVYLMAYPDRLFSAEIIFISPRVDESTFTTRIKATIDNSDQLIKLGMSVRGEIETSDETSYIKVPTVAVQNIEGKDIVFVQTGQEIFEMRAVAVNLRASGQAALTGNLNKGDRVVVEGAFILKSKLLESEMEHSHDH